MEKRKRSLFAAHVPKTKIAAENIYMEQTFHNVSIESWGWTQQGDVRADNQDSFLNWPERALWAVADGVGSSAHGAEASRTIIRDLMNTPAAASLDEHVENVLGQINESSSRLYSQRDKKATSTVVALLMQGGTGVCLWAGDSRCYLLRGGVLYQCSKDHTLRQQKIDDGSLTVPEAERMIQGNIITNAVGVASTVQAEEARFALRAGDRFLLCSDGLSKIIESEALASLLLAPTAKEAVEKIIKSISYVLQPDNITFITVFLSEPK